MIDHDVRPGSFWERLGATDRQALRAMGRRTDVPPGGLLCHQGVTAPGVYVVFKAGAGTATDVVAKEFVDSSEGDESIIDLVGPGDLVGALAPWGHPQRGNVAAFDHVAALRLDRQKFGSLLAANPQVAEAMMHTLARGAAFGGRRHAVRAAEHQQRLAYHLLELAHRFGRRTSRGVEIPLRMSQAELANWSGISRETLVRWFRLWRSRGILARRARPLTILDPEGLRRAAGPWGDEWPDHPGADSPRVEPGAVPDTGPGRDAAGAGRAAGGASIAARSPVRLEPESGVPTALRLPADKPFFTGRTVGLGKLDLLVSQSPMPRAVVVQGMAGVGKTTLAVHWAHRVAGRFPDGVIFTDLRGTTRAPATPAETMGQVLRGAGVPGDQLPRTEAELEAQCRSLLAGRRMLVILDNAADAAQIRPLVAAVNAGLVVATTQRRLPAPLPGADVRTLELSEMAVQEAVDLIAAVLGREDERIREEDRALARLARECGFLPLALAIMAARLADNPGRSIADTVRELADRDAPAAPSYSPGLPAAMLHETGAHAAGTQGLHAVLSPTFDIAYRALRREQREAFRLLGLVAGPDFTPSALAALLERPVEEAGECLEALRQAYLVQDVGPGRYRMHDLLRDFARERGLSEDADSDRLAAQRRLLAGYLAEARDAGRRLSRRRRPTLDEGTGAGSCGEPSGAAAGAAALSWFEAERRNLVAAVHQAARLGLHRTCWELADALFDFQWFRRYSQGNIDVHQAGLRAARAEEDWRAAAVMLHNLAVAHFELGGSVQAIGYGEEARRGFRSADPPDRFGEAAAQATLADVHASLGRYLTAIGHARRSLAIHESLGDGGGVAKGHETLATAYIGLADYDTALRHAGEALGIRRSIEDMPGVAETLLTLAQVHRRRGAVHEAVSHALEALYIRQDLADRHGAAQALNELARMNASLGLRDLALRDAEQALRTYQALGARHGEAKALTTLGMLMSDAARFAEAFTYCGQALGLHREIGDRSGEAETLAQTGVAYWRLGRYPEAREHLVRALEIRREIGDQHGEAHDLEHLSMVMRRLERDQEAFVLGLEALDLWHRLGAKGGLAGTLGSLARTYLRLNLYEEAEQAARQALAIRRDIGDWYGMGVGMDTFAAVLRHGGRPEEALKMELEALRVLGEVGDRHSEGTALVHLAAIYLELDRVGEALETGRQALDLATELGDTREQAIAHHTMGGASRKLGRHSRAVGHFRAEIAIRREMADHRGQRAALEGLRDACLALGDDAGAADCVRRIRAIDSWLESEGREGEEGQGAGQEGARP
ncbi:tetratricopeptide repeat protein [Actinomadura rugatobispora]|uniref:Tetratricopeptide repeat protein n=1 Tax=Actinomadura rugatobispora TaxID=1994 RepID=A0ABW1AGA4_9ACTN|nr:hypothetical protein GCM10010200_087390 [Actinomadura rugatobispora]